MRKWHGTAGEDLSASAGLAVDVRISDGKVVLAGDGQRAIGILELGAAVDNDVIVAVDGGFDAVSGAAIAKGDPLTPDATGKLRPAVGVTGDFILGWAMDTVAGADLTVGVQLAHWSNRFGNDYSSAASEGVSSTTSTTFQIKTSIITGAVTGLYLVNWSAILSQINKEPGEARLFNATDSVVLDGPYNAPKAGEVHRERVGSFVEVTLAGSLKTLRIEFRSLVSTKQTDIEQARIRLWRVGA